MCSSETDRCVEESLVGLPEEEDLVGKGEMVRCLGAARVVLLKRIVSVCRCNWNILWNSDYLVCRNDENRCSGARTLGVLEQGGPFAAE